MLNLDKLNSQLDVKNIDLSQITKLLIEHQKYIKLALLVGSLVVVWSMFNSHRLQEQNLRTRMSQEQGKLDVIKARDEALQNLKEYKSSLPKPLNVFDIITQVTNYANSNNSTIISYVPSQGKDMGLYDIIDVHFDVVSNSFKDMMLFLRKVERSDFPLRGNSWSGHEGDDGKITFTIEISAVLIHP